MKKVLSVFIVLSLLFVFVGCSQNMRKEVNDGDPGGVKVSNEPVTLTFYQELANISDEEFKSLIADPVKAKYPYITLKLVRSGQDASAEQLVAAGTVPDIVFTAASGIEKYKQLQVAFDLNGLIKQNHVDIGRFDPNALKGIQDTADQGQLYAVPLSMNFSALYYNKDIFDKFGVPYPSDRMSWDDVIELAAKVARTDGGVEYKGVTQGAILQIGTPLSLPLVDPKTEQAMFTASGWQTVFQLLQRVAALPGYKQIGKTQDAFMKDQTLAMLADRGARVGEIEQLEKQGKKLNWDLATYPSYKEAPGKSMNVDIHVLMISSTSKYKEQAFQVLDYVTDSERQLAMTKQGRLSALKGSQYQQAFGADLTSLRGKNVQGIFKSDPAPNPPYTVYNSAVNALIGPAMNQMINQKLDVNTALRQLQEKANQTIAGLKQGQ